jgi:hypothetical protein
MYVQDASYTKPALSSNVSPFLGAANAPLILLTAIFVPQCEGHHLHQTPDPSYLETLDLWS